MRGPFKFYVVVGFGIVLAYFVSSMRGTVFGDTDDRPGSGFSFGGGGGGGIFYGGSGYRGGK
jgi:hypothetical protein